MRVPERQLLAAMRRAERVVDVQDLHPARLHGRAKLIQKGHSERPKNNVQFVEAKDHEKANKADERLEIYADAIRAETQLAKISPPFDLAVDEIETDGSSSVLSEVVVIMANSLPEAGFVRVCEIMTSHSLPSPLDYYISRLLRTRYPRKSLASTITPTQDATALLRGSQYD